MPTEPISHTQPGRTVFIYADTYMVDLATVISVAPSQTRQQVAFQLSEGQYSTWHDIHDPQRVAAAVCAAVRDLEGVKVVSLPAGAGLGKPASTPPRYAYKPAVAAGQEGYLGDTPR